MWMIEKLFSLCTSFLFPEECFLCRKETSVLCDECLSKLSYAAYTPAPCIISLYSFKDERVKKLIHASKYFHRKDILLRLSEKLAEKVKQEQDSFVCIIPIPMPKLRALRRGYNHTEVLAQELSKHLMIPVSTKTLIRKTSKKRQVETTSRKERLSNQKHAFSVTGALLGTHILLVDDVTTTGATLLEARKVLLASGAKTVTGITIAH